MVARPDRSGPVFSITPDGEARLLYRARFFDRLPLAVL